MRGAALVFVGGALGSLARYGLGLVVEPFWSVWVVNVLGSLALGLLLGWLRAESLPSSRPQPAPSMTRACVHWHTGSRRELGGLSAITC